MQSWRVARWLANKISVRSTEPANWLEITGCGIKWISTESSHTFCIADLRPEMKIIATNCMPEVVSDLPYDFKKMLESCPQELGWAS